MDGLVGAWMNGEMDQQMSAEWIRGWTDEPLCKRMNNK